MDAEALIGKVLGNCTLQQLVGQGAMGAVFLAQQSRPRRQVAVKVLLPFAVRSQEQQSAFLERFRRETDAAAVLNHPHILPVHEYGERDNLAYLVTPYISGGTLRDELERQGSLPLIQVMSYLEQMAAALDFAHERGVIHRDVKPGNILKTPEGRLLLADFGLVKIVSEGQPELARLTGTGTPLGTPDYMAPEQALGSEGISLRADLYSLGVVLYHMVTGDVPFNGETSMQIAMQHIHTPVPSPRAIRADLPIAAERVILKALSKRPAERYAHAGEMSDAFREALVAAGVRLDALLPSSQNNAEGERSFKSRSLFDPVWRSEQSETAVAADTPALELPVVSKKPKMVKFVARMQEKGLNLSAFAHFKSPVEQEARTLPVPDGSISLQVTTQEGHTPLPPTLLKLRSKGEGLTMFQKPKLQPSTPKAPQAPNGVQGPQPNGGQVDGDATLQFNNQQAPFGVPQAMPGTTGTNNFMQQPFGPNTMIRQPGNFNGATNVVPNNNLPNNNMPNNTTQNMQGPGPYNPTGQLRNTNATGNFMPPFAPNGNTTRQLDNPNMPQAFNQANTTRQLGDNSMPPAFMPTNATRKMGDPNNSFAASGVFPNNNATGALPGYPTGNTGALVPYENQGMTGTMKLTQPVKVVQVPVAGQPGRYMTGFLPVVGDSSIGTGSGENDAAKTRKKNLSIVLSIIVVGVILFGSGLYLLLSPHSSAPLGAKGGNTSPDAAASAAANASATAQANTLLSDPLTYNAYNWPTANRGNPQYAFKDDGYHIIVNDQNTNAGVPLLANETYTNFAYTITMHELKGDDASDFNFFGIVLRYNVLKNGKSTFYCFLYNPSKGDYEFRKYNGTNAATADPWTYIWHQGKGKEYHTGHGANSKNIIKVAANGKQFTFYVNGKRVGTTQDRDLKSGQIGMYVNKAGSEIAFSNLLLTYN